MTPNALQSWYKNEEGIQHMLRAPHATRWTANQNLHTAGVYPRRAGTHSVALEVPAAFPLPVQSIKCEKPYDKISACCILDI